MAWPDDGKTSTPVALTQAELTKDLGALIAAMDIASVVLMFFPGAALALSLLKIAILAVSGVLNAVSIMKAANVDETTAVNAVIARLFPSNKGLIAEPWMHETIKQIKGGPQNERK